MPNEPISFQQEIDTPGAGTDSELYRAVSPLLDLNRLPEAKNNFDRTRIDKLKEDLRRGTLGLEYLTGLKSNKAETFYDNHKAQAVTSDALANAGGIGAGIGAGSAALNFARQRANLLKTVPKHDARRGDAVQRMESKLSPIDPKDGKALPVTDNDALRVFGDTSPGTAAAPGNLENVKKRVDSLDDIAAVKGDKGAKPYKAQLDKIVGNGKSLTPAQVKKLAPFLNNLRGTPEHGVLGQYADLHKDLISHGNSFKAPVGASLGDKFYGSALGDKMQNLPAGVQNVIHSLVPNSFKGHEDLINKHITSRNPNSVSPTLLRKILADTGLDAQQLKVVENGLISRLKNPASRKAYSKVLEHAGRPALIGGGIAAGGLGLSHVLKALQGQVYGKEKINDWKRNTLRSRGEFEEANRIQ
jgi:hypothetical protein